MTMSRRSLVALIVVAASTAAAAQQPTAPAKDLGVDPGRLERITTAFQGWVDEGKLPGAVLVVSRYDKVVYSKAVGFRDREQKTPMTMDSLFRIMSMTKPVASVGAMLLAEEGKLDLMASVAQYLPEFGDLKVRVDRIHSSTGRTETALVAPKRPMTVQDLMRHTAGLVYGPPIGQGAIADAYRSMGMSDRNETLAKMIGKMSKLPLAHHPGEVWEYSMATDVLGRVIEVASGVELERFIADRITSPLGMKSTGFYVAEDRRNLLAEPQADAKTGKRPPMFDAVQKPKWFSGGGGLVSTAGDYLKFCEMLLNGGQGGDVRLLSPASVHLMTSNALAADVAVIPSRSGDISPTPTMGQGFGLGFAVRMEGGQNPLPGSPGSFYWTGAYGTTFYVDPRQHLAMIMMIQAPSPENAFYRRAFRYLVYQAMTRLE